MEKDFDITPEQRASAFSFLRRQLFRTTAAITRAETDLKDRTAIVTGSNTGLGFECGRQLLELGLGKLIIAVRNLAKGEAARTQLLAGRLNEKQAIEVWKLDLSDYASIVEFGGRAKTLKRLDIVVHNAGISNKFFHLNPHTGYDEVIQTNYLSLVLLTTLMLPILKEKNPSGQPGRIVLVSSETAAWAAFNERASRPILPAFTKHDGFDGTDRYWTSKLLGQMFLSELIKHVPSSVAVVNSANPGLCYGSNLTNEWSGSVVGFAVGIITRIIGRSMALGARALTDAAVRHGPESHGQYIEDGKLQP